MPAAAAAAAERQAVPSQGVPRPAAVERHLAAERQAVPSQGEPRPVAVARRRQAAPSQEAHRPVAVAPFRPAAAVRAVLGKRQAGHLIDCACAFRERSCVGVLPRTGQRMRGTDAHTPRDKTRAASLPPCTLELHRI